MKEFFPDYKNIVDACYNIEPKRFPLYDHIISPKIIEAILNKKFAELYNGDSADLKEYFRILCDFFKKMEYDAVIYECCAGEAMPGSGCLGNHKEGVIKDRDDFNKYPWHELKSLYFDKYFKNFEAITSVMPEGMKLVGGVGNGVFECVQDIVGYTDLCYIKVDDPELYADLFVKVGDMLIEIWTEVLKHFAHHFAVCRFGDDLGFKSDTLIAHDDIKNLVLPQYKRIIDVIHANNKPFLLHSCGSIFGVMEDIIGVGINAKHSNEDVIAPFSVWAEKYGRKIGNFGGIDTDIICSDDSSMVKKYTTGVLDSVIGKGYKGLAFGTGNSVPDYASVAGYLAMNEAIREYRNKI